MDAVWLLTKKGGGLSFPGYVGEALWDGAWLLTKKGELKLPWLCGGGSMGWGLASDLEGELKLPWLCGGGFMEWALAYDQEGEPKLLGYVGRLYGMGLGF